MGYGERVCVLAAAPSRKAPKFRRTVPQGKPGPAQMAALIGLYAGRRNILPCLTAAQLSVHSDLHWQCRQLIQ